MDDRLLNKLMLMARLSLTPKAREGMLYDLDKICNWIEQLQEVDTTDVDPMSTSMNHPLQLRDDLPSPSLEHEKALSSSSDSDANYFRVPQLKQPN